MSETVSNQSRLLAVSQLSLAHPAFSEASLRWMIFKAAENGLESSGAIKRLGRKVVIDESLFLEWVRQSDSGLQRAG